MPFQTFSRYFKQTWVGSQLCGKDQWFAVSNQIKFDIKSILLYLHIIFFFFQFQWHRVFMVLTWALTLTASALIFVELGAWSQEKNPHAILGVITTTITFLQPIGALFRPAPTSSKRPIFNWLHWLGGNAAHIFASESGQERPNF